MALRSVRVNDPEAIAQGTALAQDVQPATGSLGTGFAVNIDTDLRDALAQLERDVERLDDDEAAAAADVVLVYKTQEDDRVRPEHMALHNTVWEVDDPERPVPPIAPGCRCYLEVRARNQDAANRNGLPPVDANPPESDAEAVRQFLRDSDLDASETTLGPTVGALVEGRDVDPNQLFDDAGNFVGATKARAIAQAGGNAAAFRTVQTAYRSLQGVGIGPQLVRELVSSARAAQGGDPGLSDVEAVTRALDGRLAGGAIGFVSRQNRALVLSVARLIIRANGGGI